MQPVLRQYGGHRRAGRPPTDDEHIIRVSNAWVGNGHGIPLSWLAYGQEAWIVKPSDGGREQPAPNVPRTEMGEDTQPEERQQQRGQGCHARPSPGMVPDHLVPCKPCTAYQPELGGPEAHTLVQ